jgi:hypothetical protein
MHSTLVWHRRWPRAVLLVAVLTACTPAFNWREVRFEGSALVALLPCKPDRAVRQLNIGGAQRNVSMMGCEAGGAMFTVTLMDVQDAQQVRSVLAQWQASSKATQARYLSHGTQVFEAAVFGRPQASDSPSALTQQAVDTFFSGLKLPSATP